MAKKKKFSAALAAFLCAVSLVVGCAVGFVGMAAYDSYTYHSDEIPAPVVNGELQIHFLELGNKFTGDCTYIKAGDTDILIDAGSKTSSAAVISAYLDQYVTDGKLEYVIVTHSHEDHYAGFALRDGSIFDRYECGTVIDFAQTRQKEVNDKGKLTMYGNYKAELEAEIAAGATHYTAAQCVQEGHDVFDLGGGISMKILDSYFYYNLSDTENNHSVCTLFTYGTYNYLFTGDLEKAGEEKLVQMNDLPQVELYKAGHHGSKTSSSDALMQTVKPKRVCVCCCCGSPEYTKTDANQFPTQEFIDRVAPYTDQVFCTTMCLDYDAGTFTSMNGTIIVATSKDGITVTCSNVDTLLKDWEWFKAHRTCPAAWK